MPANTRLESPIIDIPLPFSTPPAELIATSDTIDPSDSLHEDPLERPRLFARIASFTAVILPFLGFIAAVVLTWNNKFSFLNLGLFFGGYVLTALGITAGYHRYFTHRSFNTVAPVKWLLGILGSMTVEGPVIEWVATHRQHHQYTDRDGDPHSPVAHGEGFFPMLKGIFHSHIGWFFAPAPSNETMARYVPDLLADPATRFINRYFGLWVLLSAIIPAGIAFAVTGTWMGALEGFIWGGLLRVFFVHHVTWSINSVCHIWGAQPFETRDQSRDNLIFSVLAFGEGAHNTHHAFPTSARHGLKWWQPDLSYWFIRGLEIVGLASNVRVPSPERIAAKAKKH